MDKLEYIPGDLVKFATNTYTIINFEENFLHNKVCYALISTNSTKTALVADRDILPIPLTPKILEKNGWKLINGFYCSPNEDGAGVCLSSGTGYVWNAYLGRQPLRSNINSVSDLQHLLFGLNINHEMEVQVCCML